MASSETSLTGLWVQDGASTSKSAATPTKSAAGNDLKDVRQFYADSKLDSLAKEAGLLDGNGELATSTAAYTQQKPNIQPKIQMIAVPFNSPMRTIASTNVAGTPRIIRVATAGSTPNTPQQTVQVISSHNLVGSVLNAKGNPQLIQTPIQIGNPSPRTWVGNVRKRITSESMSVDDYEIKRRKGEKGSKGLRHFSMKVCEKVQQKGTTSYNEVADELVSEFTDLRSQSMTDQAYEQKNIRRRVYDALNVLMAMNIISKEKKEIKWIGLPTNSMQECQNLELEKQRRLDRIKHKTQQLQVLILQQIAFKNLVQRNKHTAQTQGAPASNSAIQLPFIIVNTSKKTVIDCSISSDKCEYLFNFNNTFEIHDDIEVLKRMGLAYGLEKGHCSPADLAKAIKMVPKNLEPYVTQMAQGNTYIPSAILGNEPSASICRDDPNMGAGPSHDQSLDNEVAMVTGISRQSSIASYSHEDPYSEDSEPESIDLH
ncbi:hypothetical protein CAPTEDRAFT_228062 [Capitella teleta]|uniref:Transcription factor Dp-1 n=1 Tax=Capitella teleta TaxID=283909 RepID=R7TP53_CAPTE|nr:hypothetical protein CAPTEDRAFT_228062 [Capitella teleta]|eukprot:ELT92810.1 hypothetical protein CAPTEDRAFT_228062 [Capitella teleta]